MDSTLLGIVVIGLLHGLEPAHGWPIAVLYSLKKKSHLLSGLISSSIISFFHLLSSIIVVFIFIFLNNRFDITSLPYIRYISAGILLILAFRFYNEKVGDKERKDVYTLTQIMIFAFTLGFVHEEEVALLAFCLGGANCLLIMIVYALSVSFSLIAITLLAIRSFNRFEKQFDKYKKYIPKISAFILVTIALLYIFNIF